MKLPGIASAFAIAFVNQSPNKSLVPHRAGNHHVLPALIKPLQSQSPSSVRLPMSTETETESMSVVEKFHTVELNTMLRWSSLIYTFAKLRKIIRQHDSSLNEGKEGTVAFEDIDLIYTQNSDETPPYEGTHIKYPLTATCVAEFMKKNNKWLVGEDDKLGFNPNGDKENYEMPSMTHLTFVDDEFDADIIEIDDEFLGLGLDTELVFGIIINRSEKRITVVFRGSVNMKDFIVDASIRKKNPEEVREFAGKKTKIHRGFSNYLFGDTFETTEEFKGCKFTQIITILKQVYAQPEYKDYKCYVTGHSLGGALTQLLGFTLAGSKEAEFLPKPIYAISYASPSVGNKHFYKQYQRLEQEDKVRHIRVSNEGDIVATVPSVGYKQTGISLHAKKDGRMDIKYENNKKSFFSQARFDSISKHGLVSHSERMFKEENADILAMDVDQLYETFANIKTKN